MRMWMVDPKIMCRKHLLGEHAEVHMLYGCISKGRNIRGFIDDRLVDPYRLFSRHQELVTEMNFRGYKHLSPIGELSQVLEKGHIDSQANALELNRRCKECQRLIKLD